MKQTPEDLRLAERMAPGVLSREGFLGDDPRPLSEIIAEDNSTLMNLGVTHEQIADRLKAIQDQATEGFGKPVKVGENLRAAFHEGMGRIPSPYADGIFPKGETELTEAPSGASVPGRTWRFTPLSIHLIRAHGFYQGRGSRYRLEPAELVDALGLA